MSPFRSRTFLLCIAALLFGGVALLLGLMDGMVYVAVIGAVAGLYGVNDLAGGYREGQNRPAVPETVATVEAETVNVSAAEGSAIAAARGGPPYDRYPAPARDGE
jgi:hypothetical protein